MSTFFGHSFFLKELFFSSVFVDVIVDAKSTPSYLIGPSYLGPII